MSIPNSLRIRSRTALRDHIAAAMPSSSGLWSSTPAYIIPATAGIWLNNPNFTVAGTASGMSTANNGLFRVTQGTYNIGLGAGDENRRWRRRRHRVYR